jgi:hypothetical protein
MRLAAAVFAILLSFCIIGTGFPDTAHSAGQGAGQGYQSGSAVPGYGGDKGPTPSPATPGANKPGRSGDPTGLSGPAEPYAQGGAMGGSAQTAEISGRLVKMGSGFGLVTPDGKAYVLQGGPRDMDRLVGQEVAVHGARTDGAAAGKKGAIKVLGVRPAK